MKSCPQALSGSPGNPSWPPSHSGGRTGVGNGIVMDAADLPTYVGRAEPQWLPRGFREPDAARYLGISRSHFQKWVREGVMPGPKKYGGIVVWDRHKLDDAFNALPERDEQEVSDDIWNRVSA